MTPHPILVVVVRLLAILWFLHLATLIGPTAITVEQTEGLSLALWMPLLVQFIAILWLWSFPASLASRLLRLGSSQSAQPDANFAEWQNLAFIAVGIFVLARAVPDAVYWFTLIVGSPDPASSPEGLSLDQKANVLATVVELAVGSWLTFGAAGIASIIFRLRTAGLPVQRPPG